MSTFNDHANLRFNSATSDDFSTSGMGGSGNHMDDVGMVCPVCLAIPEDQIFNCVQCDNMLCGSCRAQESFNSR